jgi:hypothetical protein
MVNWMASNEYAPLQALKDGKIPNYLDPGLIPS